MSIRIAIARAGFLAAGLLATLATPAHAAGPTTVQERRVLGGSGGNGTDFLTGNNVGNTLVGGAGFDVLDGRGGHDLCVEGEVYQNCEDLIAP